MASSLILAPEAESDVSEAGEFSSCVAQFDACHNFMRAHASLGWVWNGRRYDDQGESGARRDRPALTRLLADFVAGNVERVIVYRLDRLTRNLLHGTTILQELRDQNVAFTIVTAPELGSSAQDSLMLNILASFAEFEHELTHDRLHEARVAYKNRGLRVAGVVPFGYVADPVAKQPIVVPLEAEQVRSIFELAAAGSTPAEIASLVTQLGWRTKQRVGRRTGKASGGNAWAPRRVLAMLSNPVYCGAIRNGASTLSGQHKAIVTEDLWNRAQAQVASRRVCPTGPRHTSSYSPLRSLLVCGRCGRQMGLHQSRRGNVIRLYYRCRSTSGGRPPCSDVCLSVSEATRFVLRIHAQRQTYSRPHLVDSDGDVELASEFCSRWFSMNAYDQEKRLTHVLEKVIYDPDRKTIEVTFDRAKVTAFIELPSDSD